MQVETKFLRFFRAVELSFSTRTMPSAWAGWPSFLGRRPSVSPFYWSFSTASSFWQMPAASAGAWRVTA